MPAPSKQLLQARSAPRQAAGASVYLSPLARVLQVRHVGEVYLAQARAEGQEGPAESCELPPPSLRALSLLGAKLRCLLAARCAVPAVVAMLCPLPPPPCRRSRGRFPRQHPR